MRKVYQVGMNEYVACTEISSILCVCSDKTDTGGKVGRQHVHQQQARRQREPEEELELMSSSSDETVPGEDVRMSELLLYKAIRVVFSSTFQLLHANGGSVYIQKASTGFPVIVVGDGTTVYV